MNLKNILVAGALCGVAALVGCGGGGGSSSPVTPPIGGTPTPPSNIPGPSSMNSLTSYTVYAGQLGSQTYLEVMPLGTAPGTISNPAPVAGAVVQYPDGSTQIADVLGNFDASQSAWAAANIIGVFSNPNLNPEVLAYAPGTQDLPADAYVSVYSSTTQSVTASHDRRVLSGTAAAAQDLAGVAVFPRGYAMFDSETRVYHAAGVDTDGSYVGLNSATVNWSLATPNGCGAPAGKLTAVTGDVSRELYTPPSAGTFPGGCQDIVVASVTSNGSNYSGSGNAYYYDPSTGVTLQGQLTDATSKAVGNGIVDLYGGGREFYHGKLFAIADASGNFKRLVPSNRTLYPFAGNPTTAAGKTTYAFFTVNPATIAIGAGGSTTTQNLQETSLASVNPFKPLPPVERFIRDGWFVGDLAQEQFPFGEAQSGGTFVSGSLENILQNPAAGASGTITKGGFTNWTYVWDSSAKTVVFQQPTSQEGGRHAMQVTIAGATMQYQVGGSTACPANNTCYNYIQYYNPAGLGAALSSPIGTPPSGTILAQDGSFDQNVVSGTIAPAGSNFIVGFTRNVYSVGHQTAGSPLYVHAIAYNEVPGSVTSTISDTWNNAAGKSLASINVSRTAGSGTQIFTYSGSGTRTFYKPDGTQNFQVTYSLTNGVINKDHSGGFTVTLNSGLPNPSDNGTAVTFVLPVPAAGGNRATGTVDNSNVSGLTSGHVATFTVSPAWITTVTMDASLGGNVIAFHL